ncbi:MAG: phosphotransferase, partial [Anaerolineae bacterium]|nr:phosphotransferase [Anaerolineae bacterium]
AQRVISVYGIAAASIKPLNTVNNAVFAVETSDAWFVLRLHRHGLRRLDALESELHWLEAINRETRLCVPRPVPSREGTWLSSVAVEGLDKPLRCSLLSWLEGIFYKTSAMTPEQVAGMGAFLAQLHQFSELYQPPADFYRPRLDWEGLFGVDSPYNPGAGDALFSSEQRQVLDAVAERARVVMQTLGESPREFGLIHGDFIAKNVLFNGDRVCAIDFDDCGFGYFLYDLAPPLLQMTYERHYPALKAALWAGYVAVRPLPDSYRDLLEVFIAARHVASCRWIAGNLHNPNVRARAPQIIAERVEELRRFLATGRVERKSEML